MDLDHGLMVSVGAVIGGLFTKVLTNRQRNHELKQEEASQIRKELRTDVSHLEEKIEKISLDLDQWKDRYYRLADENVQLRSRCRTLELEVDELRRKVLIQTSLEPEMHPEDLDK